MKRCVYRYTILASCLLSILMAFSLSSESLEKTEGRSTLTVRGNAVLSKPSDELQMNIGVISQARTAESALAENSQKATSIIDSLQKTGLGENEYQTGRFNIRPMHSQRPANAPAEWSPEIVGYEVTHSLSIRTTNVDKAGELIDQATKSGANHVDTIKFSVKDPQKYHVEAINVATDNALKNAKALSCAAGVKLISIKSLSLDDAQMIEPRTRGLFLTKAIGTESTPIEAGNVEIHAAVTVQYAIDD